MFRLTASCISLCALLAAALPAMADELPDPRTVSYAFRVTPTNQNSAVKLVAELAIVPVDVDHYEVAWRIDQATFTELDTNGAPLRSWTVDSPDVDTPDRLWWVAHVDPQSPAINEFASPPDLAGVAEADDTQDPDLEYSLSAGTLDPAHQNMYSGNVAAITHVFSEYGEEEPIEEGNDEPAEVGG